MASKLTKKVSGAAITPAEALALAVGQHVQTLTDREGYPMKVTRVALVARDGGVVAQPLGGYRLRTVDREWIEQAAKDTAPLPSKE